MNWLAGKRPHTRRAYQRIMSDFLQFANVPPAALSTPGHAARRLLDVIAGLTPADSGRFIAWDGSPVPW